ncbi:MAG TPA: hypothetical protein VFL60_09405 [Gaiellaceae bacterium]|nr:hypothetical protein [Gaiellaceae bacterium]
MTRILLVLLAALATAPAALADGPMPYAAQNTPGVLSPGGKLRYVALPNAQNGTIVEAVATRGGTVHATQQLLGPYGIPYVTSPLDGTGLSADGRTLVLGDASTTFPRAHSSFVVLRAPRLRFVAAVSLRGDFAFDALSPDGSRLYLIQHTTPGDQARYVVRAYDLVRHRLLPGRVADRTQKSWVMQGYPVSRTTSVDGRWVYTLYGDPGGFPFVHALDTVRGVAHCVGLPWRGSDDAVWNMRLTLHGGGLAVHWASGRRWLRLDAASWRLSPDRGAGGPPWWAWAAVALAAATIVGAYGRRTRALAAGAAGRDRSPARLGSWLPLTRTR